MRLLDDNFSWTSHPRQAALAVAMAIFAAWASASCSGGTQIASPDSGVGGIKQGDEEDSLDDEEANLGADGGPQVNGPDGTPIGVAGAAGDTPSGPIDYPAMDFLGRGVATCKGDNYPTTAQVATTVDDNKLDINLYAASLQADKDKAEDEANKKLRENTGITSYTRITAAERDAFKAQGVKFGSYAIFAKSVVKQRQGQSFAFDKPLPVYPLPASAGPFETLRGEGVVSWSAHVTGSFTFDVTVTLQVLSVNGDNVMVKLQTNIAQDQPGAANHRSLYEVFPIPREATYTLNIRERDVRRMDQISWFNGQECDNKPEQVSMTYNLCKKTSQTKNEQFPCN
jgi:hypothetical protein